MGVAVPPLLLAVALAAAPQGSLACADPALRAERPDGQYVMTACRRASWRLAMPGQGSDGPAWAVLRDRAGHIAGVVSVGSLLELDQPVAWEHLHAVIPLAARIEYFPEDFIGFLRVIEDRRLRLVAHLGLAPRSEEFR